MRMGILGKKVGMTQIFDENGLVVPVTVVDTSDCYVTQVKTRETDGYNALQMGIGVRKPQNVNKARAGAYKKAGVAARSTVKEVRVTAEDKLDGVKAGQKASPAMFAKGDRVDVIGISRGKGFQGVVKRWGFHGADATHGVSEYFRHGGSNGTNTFPGKVLKNKGMPGQTGNVQITVPNILVADVKADENLIYLRGAVPGFKGKYVMIRSAKKYKLPAERPWVSA